MIVACIIQARMTSKRFPGKTLALLAGKPVLAHVLEIAKAIPGVNKVVCAFPEDDASLPILDLCREQRVIAFAGDEDDVLGRYYEAAKAVNADIIMRITADCPFLDPLICHFLLDKLKKDDLDYASNIYPERTFPKGRDCEVFTFECLEAAYVEARDPYDREHVTPWMQKTGVVKKGNMISDVDYSDINYCVDYPDDIKRLEDLLRKT
jgi:spore coat polysaccharide biosynthesis protein SpsF